MQAKPSRDCVLSLTFINHHGQSLRPADKGKAMFPSEPQSQAPRSGDPGAPVPYQLRRGSDEVFEYLRALKEIEAQLARCIADLSSDGQLRSRLTGL
jgi:hypothetical protein